jgi:hypothetical protein
MKNLTFFLILMTALTYGCASDRSDDYVVEEQREELGIEDEGFYEEEGLYEDPGLAD